MYKFFFLTILLLLIISTVHARIQDEIIAIKKTASNYMESWYQGDAKKNIGFWK